jgi:Tol biopolymer transport system component
MGQDLLNAQLGNYRIQRLLGRGGFAEVYQGEHVYLKTPAAIKVLNTGQQNAHDFLQEARLLASLRHPHIVSILEFDLYQGQPFLVMDYLPYGTMRQRWPRGSVLPLESLVDALKQVAEALHYLHERGLTHGDVKPENILIGEENRLHLSDFGIAVLASKEQAQAMVGTVEYMAPEQFQRQPVPASDQYALGIMAYEWLCGTPPFAGSYIEISTQHIFTPPPSLRTRAPYVAQEVEAVVLRALSKAPEQRFPGVRAFVNALEEAYQGSATTVRREPLPTLPAATRPSSFTAARQPAFSRRALLVAGGTGVAALGLATAGGVAWWKSAQGSGAGAVAAVPSVVSRAPTSQQTAILVGNVYTIYQRQTAPITALAWSPDGKRVASASGVIPGDYNSSKEHEIHVWGALDGGNPLIYQGHNAVIYALAWSPDGKYIASGGEGSPALQVWEAASGKRLAALSSTGPVTQIYWHGSEQVLFATGTSGHAFLWYPHTPARRTDLFTAALNEITGYTLSPDGKYILLLEYPQAYRLADGQPMPIYDGNGTSPYDFRLDCWAPNSQRVVASTPKYPPYVWNPFTGHQITEFDRDAEVSALAWTPDSRTIASYGRSGYIFTWGASTGREVHRYYPRAKTITSIAWSPDGRRIASGGEQGSVEVWQAM